MRDERGLSECVNRINRSTPSILPPSSLLSFFILTAGKSTCSESTRSGIHSHALRGVARSGVAVLGLLACFWGMWSSGREGLSQMLAGYGLLTNRLDAAQEAVALGPATPEAHYARASLLFDQGELAEAVQEYERAAALRPHDYVLWLELGRARDQADDTEGAIAAFKQSVRLAPFYAQPRWQLGNTLYRAGRLDEAFRELRRAATSNPKLLPQLCDLAWAASPGDAQAVELGVQPQTASAHMALARLFVRRGKTSEAVAQFRAAGSVSNEERRALLTELLAARSFDEAYEVWSSGGARKGEQSPSGKAAIINGGFESPVNLDDPGFGWQLPQDLPAVEVSQDTAAPHAGAQSLRLVWNGNAATGSSLISQLVLVEPNTHYRLRFAARTEKLITAGLPQIAVADASSSDDRTLGAALTLPQGTSPWQDYAIEFTTASDTRAVRISLRRQNCSSNPCPVFGQVWLDDFSIRKM
jgi:Tfp pilus assembly protein PilF